jgi:hypothetical protein
MTTEYASAISRHLSPELCIVIVPPETGGRREDRVLPAPAVPRAVCAMARAAHEHTGSGGASRPSLRNGLTAYLVLSPENGDFASVIRKALSPLADLMPAPRHQDHTTSPYASGAHVARAVGVHRIPPRVRDVRERPSSGGTGGVMRVIWGDKEVEYFCGEGLTRFRKIRSDLEGY